MISQLDGYANTDNLICIQNADVTLNGALGQTLTCQERLPKESSIATYMTMDFRNMNKQLFLYFGNQILFTLNVDYP